MNNRQTHSWRLVDTGPLDGATNMAVDEALLASFNPEVSRPVLRLYGWNPPALSLGRYQQATEALDLERCAAAGVSVVRRITGGGVIYHAAELTYSIVCAPCHLPPADSIKESFRQLTAFLLHFYRELGLVADYAVDVVPAGVKLGERTLFCFAGKESYDILISGRKIGGNAQRRTRQAIFQHGSIPLKNSLAQACSFLRHTPAGVAEGTTSLTELGITTSASILNKQLAAAFRVTLGTSLVTETLTPEEAALADRLRAEKYTRESWTVLGDLNLSTPAG
jgi:lipoate-protein ligase A